MRLGFQRPLGFDDLYLLDRSDESDTVAPLLDGYRDEVRAHLTSRPDQPHPEPRLFHHMLHIFWRHALAGLVLEFLSAACILLSPLFLQQILLFVQPVELRTSELWLDSGVALALILFALQIGVTVFQKTGEQMFRKVQMNSRALVVGAVYEKSMRLSASASQKHSQGHILTLINVDSELISSFMQFGVPVLTGPVQIIVAVGLLVHSIGVSAWAAVAVLVVLFLAQAPLMTKLGPYIKTVSEGSDVRIKNLREFLYASKIVKLRAMEDFFTEKITAARGAQLVGLKKMYAAFCTFITIGICIPVILPVASFVVYSEINGRLDPTKVFPALVLFQILFTPMLNLPMALSSVASALVSWTRVSTFLSASECTPLIIQSNSPSDSNDAGNDAIAITNGTFRWESVKGNDKKTSKKEKKAEAKKVRAKGSNETLAEPESAVEIEPLFQDLNLRIPKGLLTAIVAPVGGGKSSLLSAIIGEMTVLSGHVSVRGKLAYCEQTPWIQTATVRDNILFGHPLDEARLRKVVRMCSLESDVQMLAAGLDTEIGEKGVNLSGGQQARLALARAVYDPTVDIFLLDDPISALDAHVGQEIFLDCIKDGLKGKTRVLVTHHLHTLPDVDHIVVLDHGRVAEQGSFKELIGSQGGVLAAMMKDYKPDESSQEEKDAFTAASVASIEELEDLVAPSGGLIVEEEQSVGAVKWDTYKTYFSAAGGWTYVTMLIVATVVNQVVSVINSYFLVWWTDDKFGWTNRSYELGFGLLALGAVLSTIAVNVVVFHGNYLVARDIHVQALKGLMMATMDWFDSQPIGRILSRQSKDVAAIDEQLWDNMIVSVLGITSILSSLILMAIVNPYTLILFAPILVAYWYILRYYRASFRELKRMNSTLRSPLSSHITETLTGVPSIRAFAAEARFLSRQRTLMDASTVPLYLQLSAGIWISLRLELSTSFIILLLALLGVKGIISTALLGLAFAYCIPLTQTINMVLNTVAYLEANVSFPSLRS
ncbi:hypothetical protein HKX48_001706 [Thoreauomyces humboldtii]|nr:hypothetical protein HKX48_001706 [Thoreauomyces humboldtii]